jgi:hypothetical protein
MYERVVGPIPVCGLLSELLPSPLLQHVPLSATTTAFSDERKEDHYHVKNQPDLSLYNSKAFRRSTRSTTVTPAKNRSLFASL